jgi:hypothetical protein
VQGEVSDNCNKDQGTKNKEQKTRNNVQELITSAELQSYFKNDSFVLKTQQQISKDFAQFHLFFDDKFENEALTKVTIEQLITERLVELIKEGESRLLQLLYTIDLPEKDFLTLTMNPNFLQLLSEKILYREAYKVFLRAKFKTS